MSIDLVNLSFKQKDLTPAEKHILTILAFRANENLECWPSFKSIMHDSGYCRDTVNRCLSILREKQKIFDTGKRAGKTKSVIVYKIVINKQYDSQTALDRKQSDGAWKQSDSRTAKQSDGKYRKDHINKDKRKEDFFNSEGPKAMKEIIKKLKTGS